MTGANPPNKPKFEPQATRVLNHLADHEPVLCDAVWDEIDFIVANPNDKRSKKGRVEHPESKGWGSPVWRAFVDCKRIADEDWYVDWFMSRTSGRIVIGEVSYL